MVEPGDENGSAQPRTPFPGDGFWNGVESLLRGVGLATPRMLFKLRQARARWEQRRAASANIDRGVSYTHKACPGCGRLVDRRATRCPYCDASTRWAPRPGLARALGLAFPHGSVAMTLVGLNVLLFIVSTLASARAGGGDAVAALLRPDLRVLYNMGGLDAGSVLSGQIWRLWNYQFLHFGALHIFFNLYALFALGPAAEDVYGPSKLATLYWTTGVGAGCISLATKIFFFYASGGARRPAITIGASGAIFGLIGLLIGHAIRRGGAQGSYMRAFLTRWAIYGVLMGFVIGADNAAHIGGLATGFVFGLVVPAGEPAGGVSVGFWRVAALAAGGLTLAGFAAAALAPHA